MRKLFLCLYFSLFLLGSSTLLSQTFITKDSGEINISGYLETYYIYDFNEPVDNNRPSFIYSHNRHNEINLNLGYMMLSYESERVKSSLGLMSGTYTRANLALEPSIYRSILEATIGYKLTNRSNTWLTTGVFPSHIGFESAVGADCYTMTRSLMAEGSPYYLSGVKVEHASKNDKWQLGLTAANGWQRIHRSDPLESIGVGHHLSYSPNENLSLNSNSYLGKVGRDSVSVMRYFHDFYTTIVATSKLTLVFAFDFGLQESALDRSQLDLWYTPALVTSYRFSKKTKLGFRAEYFYDPSEIIVGTYDMSGFATYGFSLNFDYKLTDRLLFRTEVRDFLSDRNIFKVNNQRSNNNLFLGSSLSLKID